MLLRTTTPKRTSRKSRSVICWLRSVLFISNTVLGLVGLAILGYSMFVYIKFEQKYKSDVSCQWFILATAVAGGLTVATACLGLAAGCPFSVCITTCYSYMLITLLLGQLGLAIAFFIDDALKRWPAKPGGEPDQVRDWVSERVRECKWLGVALLAFQVFAVAVLLTLSTAFQNVLDDSDDDDDEGDEEMALRRRRRRPLNSTFRYHYDADSPDDSGLVAPSAAPAAPPDPIAKVFSVPVAWSRRLRDKYGLDPALLAGDGESSGLTSPRGDERDEPLLLGKDRLQSRTCCLM